MKTGNSTYFKNSLLQTEGAIDHFTFLAHQTKELIEKFQSNELHNKFIIGGEWRQSFTGDDSFGKILFPLTVPIEDSSRLYNFFGTINFPDNLFAESKSKRSKKIVEFQTKINALTNEYRSTKDWRIYFQVKKLIEQYLAFISDSLTALTRLAKYLSKKLTLIGLNSRFAFLKNFIRSHSRFFSSSDDEENKAVLLIKINYSFIINSLNLIIHEKNYQTRRKEC